MEFYTPVALLLNMLWNKDIFASYLMKCIVCLTLVSYWFQEQQKLQRSIRLNRSQTTLSPLSITGLNVTFFTIPTKPPFHGWERRAHHKYQFHKIPVWQGFNNFTFDKRFNRSWKCIDRYNEVMMYNTFSNLLSRHKTSHIRLNV